MLIPRVFHQIWLGPNPLPDQFAAYQRSWLDHHPGWELRMWTEENVPRDLRRREVFDRLRVPAERADILRLELLWRFGGVYMDVDFECLRSIELLIDDVDFFTADLERGRVNNALIGSVAGHPILDRALDEVRPREFHGYDKEATGPLFFDRLVKEYPEVKVFSKEIFYPQGYEVREHGYAVHHNANSWKDLEVLRIDLQKARRREQKAKDEARLWHLRCDEAEAELASVKATDPVPARREALQRFRDRRVAKGPGRAAAFALGILAALAVATLDGYDGISRIVADHDNFGDVQYLVIGLGWLPLALAAVAILARRSSRSDRL
jgi:inositol phosphorylceramide mannosyltransferase catalytic subunit